MPICNESGLTGHDHLADIHVALHDARMVEISGKSYAFTVGSDLQRDGMYLEVADDTKTVLAEVFYSDCDNSMTFTGHRTDLPLPLVELLIARAKERLTPMSGKGS